MKLVIPKALQKEMKTFGTCVLRENDDDGCDFYVDEIYGERFYSPQ